MARRNAKRLAALSAAVAGVAGLFGSPGGARADLQWDADANAANGPTNGSGTWDNTTPNWFNGSTDQPWDNSSAFFGGNPFSFSPTPTPAGGVSTVTLGANISALNLTFSTPGYAVSGGTNLLAATGFNTFSLNLLGTAGTPSVITTNSDARISAPMTGAAGFTKSGAGNLFLTSSSSFGGVGQAVTVNSGKLAILNDTDLGNASNAVTLNGGTLQLNNISGNAGAGFLQVNRTINIGNGGGAIDVQVNGGAGLLALNGLVASSPTNTLTKTGLGQLFVLNTNNYNGPIVIGPNGGSLDVRSQGALTSATSITINPGSTLNVDNNGGIANSVGTLASTNIQDRIGNSTTLTLNGGTFSYNARNAAGQIREVVGTVNLNQGQSQITANANGQGGEIEITNLTRTPLVAGSQNVNGGATVNFTGNGTFGTAGNNGRIFLDAVNGVAPADQSIVGGYATVGGEFAGYTTANGVIAANNAAFTGNVTAFPAASNPAANVRLTAGPAVIPAGGLTINSLNRAGGFDITFAGGTPAGGDVLNLASGGLLFSNNNQNFGTTTARGVVTAGGAASGGVSELFVHVNGSTTTFNSVIANNTNGAAVALVKDQTGQLTLSATNSTYTGGTYVQGAGSLTTGNTAGDPTGTTGQGYLGTGPVFLNNATLNLGAAGALGASGGTPNSITVVNNGELVLTNGGGAASTYNAPGDRFSIGAGSIIYANSPGANQGFNSLTRVASFTGTGGGQVILAPDAIVQYNQTNAAGQGQGTLAIQNLGTSADLYFAPGGNGGTAQSVTVGTGTPYKGLSTDRGGKSFDRGTIIANSDFFLQGLNVNGGIQTLTIGGGAATAINNVSGAPVRAFVTGNVTLNGNNVASFPNSLTFVATPGSTLLLNGVNALGADAANPANNANVVVQQGAIFNIAPSLSEVNGNVVMEAGSRFLGDDNATGTGSTGSIGGPGSITFQTGAIFDLTAVNALSGNTTLNWQPGAILRVQAGSPVGVSTRVSPAVTYELFNGDRSLTNQATPEVLTLNGGIITNDSNSRAVQSGNGRLLIGPNGETLAGTVNTQLGIADDFDLQGNTLTIGLNDSIAGNPKAGGAVRLDTGGNRSTGSQGTISVAPGAQLLLNSRNVLPDQTNVVLGANSILQLQVQDFIETVGSLSGVGTVQANTGGGIPGANLRVGLNNASTTFAGAFAGPAANNNNPRLTKVGSGTLNLTGVSTATNNGVGNTGLQVDQGTVLLNAGGQIAWQSDNVNRTGTLTLDNTAQAVNNRLGGTALARQVSLAGGTFNLIGNASAPVTEAVTTFTAFGGGQGTVNITPGAGGATTFNAGTVGGRSISTFLLHGNNLGAAPGANVSTFVSAAPNLFGTVAAGQVSTALRPDILSDTPSTGGTAPLGFTTQDNATNGFRLLNASEYNSGVVALINTNNNTQVSATQTLTPPVPTVTDSQIQSLVISGGGGVNNAVGQTTTNAGTRLVVKSGGVLVQPGVNATLTSPAIDSINVPYYFHTYGNLTVNGAILGNGGFVKAGTGNLTLGAGAVQNLGSTGGGMFIGLNDGTTTLAGANNSFLVATGGNVNAQDLYLAGGTLDLAGNSQTFRLFTSENNTNSNSMPGTGGNIVSTGGPATITFNGTGNSNPGTGNQQQTSNGFFTGAISGQISLVKSGVNNETFNNVNSFTGSTALRGGSIQLRDSGTFANTSSLVANYSLLTLDNQQSLFNVTNRVNAAAPVTLRGANLLLLGMEGEVSTQQFQAGVTLDQSTSQIGSLAGQAGASDILINNLVRTNLASAVDFRGNNLGRFAPAPTAGATVPLMNQDSRILLTQINGAAPAAVVNATNPATVGNGFLGSWAVVNENDFAAYATPQAVLPTNAATGGGVGAFNNGLTGFPNYATTLASGNITSVGATVTVNGATNAVTGALRLTGGTSIAFTNASDVLNLETGGLLFDNQNNGRTIGTTAIPGHLTAGGTATTGTTELFVHANQNVTTLNSFVNDNTNGARVALVKDLGATLVMTANQAAPGSPFTPYSGGTFVNGGTLQLNVAGANGTSVYAVPGDLTIQNATVNFAGSVSGQIAATSNLTINGGGVLTLGTTAASSDTLASVTFNGSGGGNPTVNVSTASTLRVNGPITSANDNAFATPTIAAGNTTSSVLDLGGATRTISVTGSSPLGLVINPSINNGGIIKTGASMLALGGVGGTFAGGLQINAGQVRLDTATAAGTTANLVTVGTGASSPAGTALVVNTGTALPATLSVNLNGGTLAPYNNNITVAGPVAVGADSTIALADYYQATTARNVTVSGALSGAGRLTFTASPVNGQNGTFTVNNPANTYAGPVTLGANGNITVQSTSNVGNVLTAAPLTLQGGTINFRDNGSASNTVLAGYGNDVTVNGNAVLNVDRSTANTGNTFQFGALNLNNAALTTQANGNGYVLTFANTATVTGNAAVNAIGGNPVNLAGIAGAGSFSKLGASQVNVTAAGGYSGSTAVSAGTLRLAAAGNQLGAGPLTVQVASVLQSDPTAGTVTANPSSILNDGLVQSKTGTLDFGTKFINSSPILGAQPLSAFTEKFDKPSDVGAANFDTAAADVFITLENANNFLTPVPGPGKAGPGLAVNGATPLSFDQTALSARSGAYYGTTEQGVAYRGTITIGGTVPAGPVTFATNTDDGSSLYVDLNKDGSFTANERIVNNFGPHGAQVVTGTATLAAGTYDVAVAMYNGGGGGLVEARFGAGSNVPYANLATFNPGGQLNQQGSLQVDSTATLRAGGFAAFNVTLNGGNSASNAANLVLNDNTTLTGSTASNLIVNNGQSTLSTGVNDVLTITGLTLGGGNTLTKSGPGSLLVNNGAQAVAGQLNVTAGLLGGSGTVGPVTLTGGSTLAPGNSPGILNTGNLVMGSTTSGPSTLAIELAGNTPGNGANNYDQVNVVGTVALTNAGLTVTDINGFAPVQGGTFVIINNDGADAVAGTFTGLPEGATLTDSGNGAQFSISYVGGTGNDVVLTTTAVPEPAGLALSGLAMTGLLARRRRTRKA